MLLTNPVRYFCCSSPSFVCSFCFPRRVFVCSVFLVCSLCFPYLRHFVLVSPSFFFFFFFFFFSFCILRPLYSRSVSSSFVCSVSLVLCLFIVFLFFVYKIFFFFPVKYCCEPRVSSICRTSPQQYKLGVALKLARQRESQPPYRNTRLSLGLA